MISLIDMYRKYMPIWWRYKIGQLRSNKSKKESLLKIIKDEQLQMKYSSECAYMIKKNEICVIPYSWTEEYDESDITVYRDKELDMPYVMVEGKKLYFPKRYPDKYIRKYFLSLLIEQDERSPHFYFKKENEQLKDAVWFDVGAAEGYISLRIVSEVKQLYLVECDEDWVNALKATFAPWEEKVKIINRYASNETLSNTIRLDSIKILDTDKVIMKLDVEGMENAVLEGSDGILKRKQTQVYCCTYHKQDDEKELENFLVNYGFDIEKSDNYMYYGAEDAGFRRGVIRARKCG